MRTENTAYPTRLLRVRELPGELAKGPGRKQGNSSKSRFVAPYYLKDEEQAGILELLEQAGLGDDEGRRLFLTAAEYEVGAYRLTPDEPPPEVKAPPLPAPKSKAEVELVDLGRIIEQLSALLAGAHKTARKLLLQRLTDSDRFGREHDERYLTQLELELGRIAEACGQEDAPLPEQPPLPPPLGKHTKRLIVQLFRIYGECLEVRSDAQQLDTFSRLLAIFRDSAQIPMPCDREALTGILQESL